MKKIFTFALALFLLAVCTCTVSFAEANDDAIDVYVSVSNKGSLTVAYEKISVTDIDNDGALTINDALYLIHESKFDGGAQNGYSSAQSEYGLSITKLWGDTSGSYGYYVNDASAMSLADVIKDGDHIYAYVYKDVVAWSDAYSFFNVNSLKSEEKVEFELVLKMSGFDEQWNPISSPVKDAVITVNGEDTAFKTDENGKAVIKLDKGNYVISARTDSLNLVPAVCIANVIPNGGNDPVPGDEDSLHVYVILGVISVCAASVLFFKKARI